MLKDFNLEIRANQFYGLAGLNGAGKTTLLNILTTKIRSSDGQIILKNMKEFRRSGSN